MSKKIDFEAIRKTRLQVTAKPNIPYRIPVIDSPSSEFFFRSHPSFGGLDDPLPIWKRSGLGKGGSGLLLVKPDVVDLVRAHGGKVAMCGIWWCQYSVGGQFLVVASAESDNDWLVTAREIYEDSRNRWLKRINVGNCWEGREPPVKLPSPEFTQLKWDEVLNLGFDTEVDENHPAFLALVYGGTPPVEEK
ncbi:MAG TPA: hypothetical protein VFE60_17690 [Roseiarcus sp.]|nr:hypothetical protein [Roseiarcus sp.]